MRPAHLIAAFTDSGQIIYEPFGGSGASIVAAEKLERRCRAIDLAPEYCDVAVRRWNDLYPNQPARLDGGGSFEATAAARGVPVPDA